MPAATLTASVTRDDAKVKLDAVKDKAPSEKQQGFIDYVSEVSDGEVDLDPQTIVVYTTMFSSIYRQTPEYAQLAEELAGQRVEKSTTKSLESLKTKSPEDRAKALEVAMETAKRAADRIAKIKALQDALDGESDDDDESDSDADTPDDY